MITRSWHFAICPLSAWMGAIRISIDNYLSFFLNRCKFIKKNINGKDFSCFFVSLLHFVNIIQLL